MISQKGVKSKCNLEKNFNIAQNTRNAIYSCISKGGFTKFIIDRNGNVVKRFEPTADMKVVEDFIKDLI